MNSQEKLPDDVYTLLKEIPEIFWWRQRFATLIDYLCHPEKYPPMRDTPKTRKNVVFTFRNGKMTHT